MKENNLDEFLQNYKDSYKMKNINEEYMVVSIYLLGYFVNFYIKLIFDKIQLCDEALLALKAKNIFIERLDQMDPKIK